MFGPPPSIIELEQALSLPTNPIGMRMRAAYYLKQSYTDTIKQNDEDNNDNNNNNVQKQEEKQEIKNKIISILGKELQNKNHGSLMRHEFAFVLGQIQDKEACNALEKILIDSTDCVMVRHECAEALGAISNDETSRPILQSLIKDTTTEEEEEEEEKQKVEENVPQELVDTCRLALSVMDWRKQQKESQSSSSDTTNKGTTTTSTPLPVVAGCPCMFGSIDPAPSYEEDLKENITKSNEELTNILQNSTNNIFERYRALFSLRNRNATKELCNVLTNDTSSALLRHEIAYVLGQLSNPISIESLQTILLRRKEHVMVRHEAAEALGAIMEFEWDLVSTILNDFIKQNTNTNDNDNNNNKSTATTSTTNIDAIVESCIVALDAGDYFRHGTTSHDDTNDHQDDGGIDEQKQKSKNNNEENISNVESQLSSTSFTQQKNSIPTSCRK